MSIHVLGIRHHGPGSARNVKAFLEESRPDIILVEGPPEGDELLRWATHSELKPPVAILAYRPDKPQRAVFYPFAEFSPEWQAIQYGGKQNVPVRFMDLPLSYRFALDKDDDKTEIKEDDDGISSAALSNAEAITENYRDPLKHLAVAAGFDDGERWWEYMFEQRMDHQGTFEAVYEAMRALRSELPEKPEHVEKLREAYMRKMIRQAEKDGFATIAVVCGAWHGPALVDMPKAKDDADLLKGLAKVKVETTWIPWTYNRLTFASGYGAGINSPGWYSHLWHHPFDNGVQWMAKVAQVFRSHEMDTSVAHIIDAVRLAEALSSLRGISKSGLTELNEATLAVLCNGDEILLQLIREALIVSDTIGAVPPEIPKPPLLQDVERTQKKLRLPAEAGNKDLMLDLREELHLDRSIFLHRLQLLGVTWGHLAKVRGKGTFKEQWQLRWEPEYSILIIEKGSWGNMLEEAVTHFVAHEAQTATSLGQVCNLLAKAIPSDLPEAAETLINSINNLAAATGDVMQLLEVLPSLVSVSRYGNVRQTDETMLLGIVNSMIARICVSLPSACVAVDDDAAQKITEHLYQLSESIALLNQAEQREEWNETLTVICDNVHTAPLIAGYSTRLLADAKVLEGSVLADRFHLALSMASNSSVAASWMEGFLKGSGTILLLDERLWSLVNDWVRSIREEDFTALLPLLRRTFSQFTHAERRKIGEKAKRSDSGVTLTTASDDTIDEARGVASLPVVMQLLGLKNKPTESTETTP